MSSLPEAGTNRRGQWAVFAFAVTALVAGSVILIFEPIVPEAVRSLKVEGNRYLRAEEVERISGLEIGRLYRDEELGQAAERIRLHPIVREARVERGGGDELRLIVEERSCAAIVRAGDVLFEVDADLAILSENRVRCGGVPVIRGAFERNDDRFTDPQLVRLLESLATMSRAYPELAVRVSELHVRDGGGVTLFLAPLRVRVEMPATFDDEAMRRLYAAVSYYESRADAEGGVIDLRGDRGVLTAEETP